MTKSIETLIEFTKEVHKDFETRYPKIQTELLAKTIAKAEEELAKIKKHLK